MWWPSPLKKLMTANGNFFGGLSTSYITFGLWRLCQSYTFQPNPTDTQCNDIGLSDCYWNENSTLDHCYELQAMRAFGVMATIFGLLTTMLFAVATMRLRTGTASRTGGFVGTGLRTSTLILGCVTIVCGFIFVVLTSHYIETLRFDYSAPTWGFDVGFRAAIASLVLTGLALTGFGVLTRAKFQQEALLDQPDELGGSAYDNMARET